MSTSSMKMAALGKGIGASGIFENRWFGRLNLQVPNDGILENSWFGRLSRQASNDGILENR